MRIGRSARCAAVKLLDAFPTLNGEHSCIGNSRQRSTDRRAAGSGRQSSAGTVDDRRSEIGRSPNNLRSEILSTSITKRSLRREGLPGAQRDLGIYRRNRQ